MTATVQRTVAAGLMVGGLLLTGAAPAAADPVIGECPYGGPASGGWDGGGWATLPVAWTLPVIDNGVLKDLNGDGLVCVRINDGQTRKHDGLPSYTVMDNSAADPFA